MLAGVLVVVSFRPVETAAAAHPSNQSVNKPINQPQTPHQHPPPHTHTPPPPQTQADLLHWLPVLDRLDGALTRALHRCPALVLVPSSLSLLGKLKGQQPDDDTTADGTGRLAEGEAALARLQAEVEAARGAAAAEEEGGMAVVVEEDTEAQAPAYQAGVEVVTSCLGFTSLLLRHGMNKHAYPSGAAVSELLGARDDALAALAAQVIHLLALPPASALETRTDMPLYLPVSVYGGDSLLPRRLAALAQGWGSRSQVGGWVGGSLWVVGRGYIER